MHGVGDVNTAVHVLADPVSVSVTQAGGQLTPYRGTPHRCVLPIPSPAAVSPLCLQPRENRGRRCGCNRAEKAASRLISFHGKSFYASLPFTTRSERLPGVCRNRIAADVIRPAPAGGGSLEDIERGPCPGVENSAHVPSGGEQLCGPALRVRKSCERQLVKQIGVETIPRIELSRPLLD